MSKKKKDISAKAQGQSSTRRKFPDAWMYIIVSVFILILYGNTSRYGYVLDDGIFIENNSLVQKGISGIPEIFTNESLSGNTGKSNHKLYRPVTLTSFAIDQSISANNPSFSHFVNIFLYILLAIVFMQWVSALFPQQPSWVTLLVTLLFVCHPVHIEVVANIKSRDEILAALFGFKAFELTYKTDFTSPWIKKSLLPSLLFLLALLSKESIIMFVPLLMVAFFILKGITVKKSFIYSIPFLITGLLYAGLRQLIVGGSNFDSSQETIIHNTLFGSLSHSEFWGTKMVFLLEDLRLLLFPYPLSWDYSYNQLPVSGIFSFVSIFSLLIHLALLITGFMLLRKKPVYSFCVFFYFISFALTNNLLLLIETTVSERLLFVPSVAFCIVVAEIGKNIFARVSKQLSSVAILIFLFILIVYSGIVVKHSAVWKDNLSLFEAGAISSPQSARANFALATVYREIAENQENAAVNNTYYYKAIDYYNKGLAVYQGDVLLYNYLGACYDKTGDLVNALKAYHKVLQKYPDDETSLHEISLIYANNNLPDSSIIYAEKMVRYYPKNINGYLLLTGSYYVKKDFNQSLEYARKAWATDSTNINAIRNMAGVLQALGRQEEATYYVNKIK